MMAAMRMDSSVAASRPMMSPASCPRVQQEYLVCPPASDDSDAALPSAPRLGGGGGVIAADARQSGGVHAAAAPGLPACEADEVCPACALQAGETPGAFKSTSNFTCALRTKTWPGGTAAGPAAGLPAWMTPCAGISLMLCYLQQITKGDGLLVNADPICVGAWTGQGGSDVITGPHAGLPKMAQAQLPAA